MSHPRIAGGLLAIAAALSVLSSTGCANYTAKCQICQRRDTANEPIFVRLEDVAKMKKLPRGAVLTISKAMWEKWSSKMERVNFDPEPRQVSFLMHRLPGGDEDRLAMLAFCPDDAPSCFRPVKPLDQEFLDWVRREGVGQPPCRSLVSVSTFQYSCGGRCDSPSSCRPVRSTLDFAPFGEIPVVWCACGN